MLPTTRRQFVASFSALGMPAIPLWARAQNAAAERQFNPQPGSWRSFEITTRVELQSPKGDTRVWLPIPSLNTDYQQSLDSTWQGSATRMEQASDERYGAKMLVADFAGSDAKSFVELSSRFRTQSRALDWNTTQPAKEDPATLAYWTQPTDFMPTDGIVRKTAQEITRGARADSDKVRKLYDWVVTNTYREPKVRGCGVGDIKAMLETGNLGGKCGDINALFVGMCRSVGLPARDVYGVRLVPSAFGYKELSGNPANLARAQHCRAEVYLQSFGWVAMDPADVGKVMRLETPEWLKTTNNPVVAPVYKALFGGWEGNWLGFNTAHEVALPGSKGPRLAFLMYPQAENASGRLDPLEPDQFKYTITAREI